MALLIKMNMAMKMFICILFLPAVALAQGSNIAYLAFANGYWQVWVMNLQGEKQRQVTSSKYDKSHISWYPDGESLLVNGHQGEIEKINVISGISENIELALKGSSDSSVSPITGKVVFSLSVAGSQDNNHLWVVDENGGDLQKITNMAGLQHEPVWSHDEKWIYFLSGDTQEAHDIWRVELKTRSVEQITADHLYHFDVAVAKDGSLVFSNNSTGDYEIWVIINNKRKRITRHSGLDARPAWSANDKRIIYESSNNGVTNIWSIGVDGNNKKQLTHHMQYGARFPVVWDKAEVVNTGGGL